MWKGAKREREREREDTGREEEKSLSETRPEGKRERERRGWANSRERLDFRNSKTARAFSLSLSLFHGSRATPRMYTPLCLLSFFCLATQPALAIYVICVPRAVSAFCLSRASQTRRKTHTQLARSCALSSAFWRCIIRNLAQYFSYFCV